METSANATPDRWWIVALCVAAGGVGLLMLLWTFPTSSWVWILAGGALVFAVVYYFNPRYRYWRRANACFGTAGGLAFVPTIIAGANLEGIGKFRFVSESSPLAVLGFLGAGLYLAWLDSRQHVHSPSKAKLTSTNTNLNSVNSPNSLTGLTAGGHIIINQGISDESLRAVIDALQVSSRMQASSGIEPGEVDEELVWRLIDDIRAARRRFEREEVTKLLADLRKAYERSGKSWPKVLRTEVLLLMAEEERAIISQARAQGHQVDLTRLQALLREIHDAGA